MQGGSSQGEESRISDGPLVQDHSPGPHGKIVQSDEPRTEHCVEIGDTVMYIDLDNPAEQERQVMISPEGSNPDWGVVNMHAPIAQAILGSRTGEIVEAKLPRGTRRLKIEQITKNQL